MKNEFDQALRQYFGTGFEPGCMEDAAIFVHDTLTVARASAITLFGESVPPEIALAIYDRMVTEQKARKEARDG